MNHRSHIGTALSAWLTVFSLVAEVHATGWVDFSQNTSNTPISVTKTGPSDTTVLNKVTVTCPKTGYLIATGDAYSSAGNFSITRDTTAPYGAFSGLLRTANGIGPASTSLERVDTCAAGAKVSYRFVAWAWAGESVKVYQPRLVVRFVNTKI